MINICASVERITPMWNVFCMMINSIDVPTVCQVVDVFEGIINEPTIIFVYVHPVILVDNVNSMTNHLPLLSINFSMLISLRLLEQKPLSS